jgi:hypothetical protein
MKRLCTEVTVITQQQEREVDATAGNDVRVAAYLVRRDPRRCRAPR